MAYANKKIIPLTDYQIAETHYLFCRDCGFETETDIPQTMALYAMPCPGCLKKGFITGHPLR
jgi:hypothetical protein